jgi:N-acetylmuramoyl-L-alanine amidase
MPISLKNNERDSGLYSVGFKKAELSPVRVFSIILDDSHPKYAGEDSIGTIFYGKVDLNESSPNLNSLSKAKPLFSFIKYFPLVNEIVLILNATSRNIYSDTKGDNVFVSNYYLPNINVWNNPQQNALPLERDLKNKPNANNAEEASLGIEQNQSEKNKISLGEYFTEKDNIKSLQPFEGDLILEGRFGNSIRMGATTPSDKPNNWSSTNNIGDPITIISNGQAKTTGDTVLENINETPSSIFLLSNQNINNFIPASTNIQSIGAPFTPPSTTQALIVDTPEPPTVITPDPIIIEPPELIFEETITIPTPPTEAQVTLSAVIDDPIFALLDEAFEEGTLTLAEESINDIAGSDPDPGDDNPTAQPNPALDANWVEENAAVVATKRRGVYLKNKLGQSVYIPPPNSSLTVNRQNTRNIDYIFIHTAASSKTATPVSLMDFFFRPNTNPNPEVNGYTGRDFEIGGYHWMIEQNGDATRLYNDNVVASGVRNYNGNSIHLNWIGGNAEYNMTQPQAYTLKRLILKYTAAYPEAKVIGHNQVTSIKACPWFYVPRFAENIGVNSNQIDNSPIQGLNLDTAIQNANKASNGI